MGGKLSRCDKVTMTYGISKKEPYYVGDSAEYVDKQVFGANKDGSKCKKWSQKVSYFG